jgi:chromosomal replication initiation ATPase DnaA
MVNIHVIDEMDNIDEKESIQEVVPNLPDALDMLRKRAVLASIKHPELHPLLSDLESKSTDIYLGCKSSI